MGKQLYGTEVEARRDIIELLILKEKKMGYRQRLQL